jgi:dUTPase
MFMQKYIVFDDNNIPGIKLPLNSTLFINSGIKVALEPGTAGIFLNKSGKGNAGFDIRAQVVDEDYAGYVHLSVAFTKDSTVNNIVYCGDKLTQMVILPVLHMDPVEVDENEYDDIMKDSARGADAFGSSDVKH